MSRSRSPVIPAPARVVVPAASIYWGARIDGQFYQDYGYAPPSTLDAPFSGDVVGGGWDLFESHTGKAVTYVQWGGSGGAWPPTAYDTTAANKARTRGAFSQYGLGTSATGVADIIANNATAQTNLRAFFQDFIDHGHPVLFRPFWEMNGGWYVWGASSLTAADYVTLWRNTWQICADIADGVSAGNGTQTGNVSFFWCPNIINVGDPTPRYPGDAYVDWIGWDGYITTAPYVSAQTRFGPTYDKVAAVSADKPIAIGEMGVYSGLNSPGKAAWITDFLGTWLPGKPRIKSFNWFNETSDVGEVHIELGDGVGVTGSTAQAAFAAGIANAYFKSNIVTSGTFPSGQKVPIPS